MLFLIRLFSLFIIILCIYGCGSDSKSCMGKKMVLIDQKNDWLRDVDTVEIVVTGASTYLQAYDKTLALWQIPFVEKEVKTSCGNAHVIVCGPENGEPLILLHGMNASSTMWYPNIKALSEKYRIYAIDFFMEPGKSFCNSDISETSQVVSWYYEIFDGLGLKKFSLLGASRGGWLAVNIALHSKLRINKIVLLSPAQTFIWIRPGPRIISNIVYSITTKRRRLRNVLETMTNDVDNISQVYIDQYYIATQMACTNRCFLQMRPFSEEQLRSLTMPVLVLIGDDDIINNSKSIEYAKKLFSNVETGTIKNAGHFLSMDQADIVNKTILNFLNRNNHSVAKK